MNKTKPFNISQAIILEAYQRVQRNRSNPGIDGMSLEEFKSDWIFRGIVLHHSEAKHTTIPRQSTPLIPEQSTPPFRSKVHHLT